MCRCVWSDQYEGRTKQNINKVARYFKNELLDNNLEQKHQEQQQKQYEKVQTLLSYIHASISINSTILNHQNK